MGKHKSDIKLRKDPIDMPQGVFDAQPGLPNMPAPLGQWALGDGIIKHHSAHTHRAWIFLAPFGALPKHACPSGVIQTGEGAWGECGRVCVRACVFLSVCVCVRVFWSALCSVFLPTPVRVFFGVLAQISAHVCFFLVITCRSLGSHASSPFP